MFDVSGPRVAIRYSTKARIPTRPRNSLRFSRATISGQKFARRAAQLYPSLAEHYDIILRIACATVGAAAPDEPVGPGIAVQGVVAQPAAQQIVAGAALQRVVVR